MSKKRVNVNYYIIPVISGTYCTQAGAYDVYKFDVASDTKEYIKLSDVRALDRFYRDKIGELEAKLDVEAKKPLIAYKCDGLQCKPCTLGKTCSHTLDVRHAVNFKEVSKGVYEEQETKADPLSKLNEIAKEASKVLEIATKSLTINIQQTKIENLEKELKDYKRFVHMLKNLGAIRLEEDVHYAENATYFSYYVNGIPVGEMMYRSLEKVLRSE